MKRFAKPQRKAKTCRCRVAKTHRDCSYCGIGYMPDYVCGVCKQAGIDGKTIPGTSGVTCKLHRKGGV